MKALIFQHTPEENPGSLLAWLKAQRLPHTVHHWYRNAIAPRAANYDFLVVLGGPMNVDQEDEFPWLREEKEFLRSWLESGKPILGICLGGQLLAKALGGAVSKSKAREIGFQEISRTKAAHPAFRRWPERARVYQYHEDAFSLPPGCTSLAASPSCAHQAFALNECTLGLQFHPESTVEWIRGNAASIEKREGERFVQTPPETEAELAQSLEPMRENFFRLLEDFVAGWTGK